MSEVTRLVLMAYIDRQLDAEESERVRRQLEVDPELRRMAAIYRRTRDNVHDAFVPTGEPLPPGLVDRIRSYPDPRTAECARQPAAQQTDTDAAGSSASVIAFPTAHRQSRPLARPMWMAAALALFVAGGIAGYSLSNVQGRRATLAGAAVRWPEIVQTLKVALETQPTGERRQLADTLATIKITGTFQTSDKGYCREYTLDLPGDASFEGLACRAEAGDWRNEYQGLKVARPGVTPTRPATGKSTNPLEHATERLLLGGRLNPPEERQLIANGWTAELPPR